MSELLSERVITAANDVVLSRGGLKSNYERLFGTPERAARTLYDAESSACTECSLRHYCGNDFRNCAMSNYDALLEWLRGDTE